MTARSGAGWGSHGSPASLTLRAVLLLVVFLGAAVPRSGVLRPLLSRWPCLRPSVGHRHMLQRSGGCSALRRRAGADASANEAMAPVGPFCPFVSDRFKNLAGLDEDESKRIEQILQQVDSLIEEGRLGSLEPEEQLRLGQELRDADVGWRSRLMQMRHADDFQTRELYEFTEAHMRHLDMSLAEVEALAIWQADVMDALGNQRPLPGAPLDPSSPRSLVAREVLDSFRSGGSRTVSFELEPPASSSVAENAMVQQELELLEQDHRNLVKMGAGYGQFDAAGKELFLDQVESIISRWDAYLGRFRLMGEPGPAYLGEVAQLLERLGLSASLARTLLRETHAKMRADAATDALR